MQAVRRPQWFAVFAEHELRPSTIIFGIGIIVEPGDVGCKREAAPRGERARQLNAIGIRTGAAGDNYGRGRGRTFDLVEEIRRDKEGYGNDAKSSDDPSKFASHLTFSGIPA